MKVRFSFSLLIIVCCRPESKFVAEIVEGIWKKLMSDCISSSSDFEGLIGINKRIERVISLLCLDNMDFRIIGIWGMGGIGKTTIADAVFKLVSGRFEGFSFIRNVREKLDNRGGLDCLQHEVLSQVLDEENLKLGTPTIPSFIREKLNLKKVFIVLDDVNNFIQLETLAGGLNRFGSGSRIIITSRDKQVLHNCGVNDHNIYEVEGFNHDEALQLFCNYAFKRNHPTEDLMLLSKAIANYAKGNPLALKVLGSSLNGKGRQEWESALKKLRAMLKPEIFNVLKISYDGLDDEEKNLFLDISCFFNDCYNGRIAELLDCNYSLSVLIDKSLITIEEDGAMGMHDLLQEMGREIVRRESPNKTGNRSRLWKKEDVIRTLKNDNGSDAVEGISLNMYNQDVYEDVHLSSQVFDKMHNLRFLFIYTPKSVKVHLPNGLNYLSEELRILQWRRYPLKLLPSNFYPEKLVELDLSHSNIERLWEGTKNVPKLKWLILNDCPNLSRIPDLLDFPLLEEVHLQNCKSLPVPSSLQHLDNLWYLDMSYCNNVTKFPLISKNVEELYFTGTAIGEVPSSIQSLIKLKRLNLSRCTRLKRISTSICKLKSLELLDLDDCSELENFPEILETMEFLRILYLRGTAIKELPSSTEHLNGLRELHLSNCSKLEKLPEKLGNLNFLKHLVVRGSAVSELPSSISCLENLEELDCSGCNLMEIPEDIGCLSSLEKLNLSGNMFESLPKSIKRLSKLKFLSLRDCNKLRSLTELPLGCLQDLDATNCKQLCQALPDAFEFVRCINGGGHFTFIFTNCLKLNHIAVGNVFGDSLLLMQHTEKGSEKPFIEAIISVPGSEIPEWFRYQSSGSSVNIRVLRDNLINRKCMGFAVCAIIGFEEYCIDERDLSVNVDCHFETSNVRKKKCGCLFVNHRVSIGSDDILLGYASFSKFNHSSQELEKQLASDSDNVDISFEFKATAVIPWQPYGKVKYCAVHPIYAEPIKIFGVTIQDTGETSGKRSGRSNDHEEAEPHSTRICTEANRCSQLAIKTLDLFR